MSIEQFQETNDKREPGSRAGDAEREFLTDAHAEIQSEEKAEKLTRSVEHYQYVQKQIIELESNLKRSMDEAVAARQKKDLWHEPTSSRPLVKRLLLISLSNSLRKQNSKKKSRTQAATHLSLLSSEH